MLVGSRSNVIGLIMVLIVASNLVGNDFFMALIVFLWLISKFFGRVIYKSLNGTYFGEENNILNVHNSSSPLLNFPRVSITFNLNNPFVFWMLIIIFGITAIFFLVRGIISVL